MAEIKIEKKKPIWPWILAALAVLLVLFLIFSGSDDDVDIDSETMTTDTLEMDDDTYDTDTLTSNQTSMEVNEYVTYIRQDSEARMGLQHIYTETALTRLAAAVEAKANKANVSVQQEMDRVDSVADYLNEDTYQDQHADSLRVAFQQISNAIEKIHQQSGQNNNIDVEGLKSRAEAVKPGQLTLNQKDDVRAFFDKAADLLQQMDVAQNQMNNNMNGNTEQY